MRMLWSWLAWLLVLPTVLVLGAVRVRAAEPFAITMNTIYRVESDGQTKVRYEIRLKNTMSTVYAKEYALQINSPDVENVDVRNSEGEHEAFDVSNSNQVTTIRVQFAENNKVVGRDQERMFSIDYVSKDTASQFGKVMEVTIPRLAEPEKYQQYTVIVMVPVQFGQPSIVEPDQYTLDTDSQYQILRFTNVGKTNGISVLFGTEQVYDLDLTYHVVNSSQNVGVVQVALPPDTSYQRVVWSSVEPKPESLHRDDDGNWIAEFRLAGEVNQDVKAKGQVTVYAEPTVSVPTENPLKPRESGRFSWHKESNPLLAPQSYWPLSHPTIQKIAQDVKTPQAIMNFVTDTLDYNYRRLAAGDGKRLGAVAALEDPKNALCQEFTDVFVAVARAAGVPARRATGYALTQNNRLRPLSLVSDVLHAWPEYYDTQRNVWVPVDPTWADTTGGVDYFSKFDLRHITFSIQGRSDNLPMPAGLYKREGENGKDVTVTLAEEASSVAPTISVERKSPLLPQFGLPTRETFVLTNPTGAARYNEDIAIGIVGPVEVISPAKIHFPVIMPWSEQTITVDLVGNNWITPQTATLKLHIGDQTYDYEVQARQAFRAPIVRWVVMGAGVALVSGVAGGVLVFGLRRIRPLRRKSKKS